MGDTLVLDLSDLRDTIVGMPDKRKFIADRVRGVLAEKGFTQQRAADELEMSRAAFSERIMGKVAFGAHELLALSEELDVPISRFFPERVATALAERAA